MNLQIKKISASEARGNEEKGGIFSVFWAEIWLDFGGLNSTSQQDDVGYILSMIVTYTAET